jgi:hypothetical protein
MAIAKSRVTAQGEVSVPRGKYTFDDIRRVLFGDKKFRRRGLKELNEAKAQYVRKRWAEGRSGL